MFNEMQQIWEPAITIPIRRFREHSIEWYTTINEDKEGELYKKAQELKDACGFKWGSGIYRISCNGMTGSYHLCKDTSLVGKRNNRWTFIIYHDKWGAVWQEVFSPDSENKIPQDVLTRASNKLDRVILGYVDCRSCRKEVAYTESFGMYYDNRYCSKECAEKNEKSDRDRGR